ncbi:hypothetical protein S40288_09148 [Stachybotrys chartarum IBT 40288]|nr:hypothetical protein S40288_09148 [Stachybotrys chartarum IBT 40288]
MGAVDIGDQLRATEGLDHLEGPGALAVAPVQKPKAVVAAPC